MTLKTLRDVRLPNKAAESAVDATRYISVSSCSCGRVTKPASDATWSKEEAASNASERVVRVWCSMYLLLSFLR